ncbi:MAG: ATP synthase subunit I [Anaerolineaceae bacterium]|nr:ATP synthase subunit I [Anaerolineaceae bacterium]
MMNIGNLFNILLSFGGGMLVGLVYFFSLQYTIHHMVTAKHPALVMLGSYFLRTVFMLLAFYIIMDGELMRLLACFVGFLIARTLLIKRTKQQKSSES